MWEIGASNLECMATPWVRLFSRYTVQNFIHVKFFVVSTISMLLSTVPLLQQMTETCSLAILTSFLFLRVHYALKFIIGICVVAFYAWNVWVHRSNIFHVCYAYFSIKKKKQSRFFSVQYKMYFIYILQSSDTWNPHLEPKLAHILTVVFLTFSLHLIDRQVSLPKSHFHKKSSRRYLLIS